MIISVHNCINSAMVAWFTNYFFSWNVIIELDNCLHNIIIISIAIALHKCIYEVGKSA